MKRRLRTNILLSFLNALITLLFPLITYPYVSRVLAPEGIGAYNIAFSVMSYFLLFANLGIPIYAVRAVAKVRDNEEELRKISTGLMVLHAISTAVIFAVYITYVCLAANTQKRFWVNLITGFHIIAIFLSAEWFYQGREEYGAITIKNLIVKTVSLVLILLFVKDTDDIIIYAAIMIFSVLAYGVFNFIHLLTVVRPSFKQINLKALIRPVLLSFALYAASRLASGLDVIMIDLMLGESAEYVAGQYGVATKFVNVIIDLLLVINTVMLPRLAMHIQREEKEEAKKLSQMIQEIMFMFVLPATVGLIFVSEDVTMAFFGQQYIPAINTMMVMSGNAFLAVFTNFLGIQILYAYGRDIYTTIAILIGAVINILCNLFLIPRYYQLGAALATVISNSAILIIEIIGTMRWKYLKYVTKSNLKTVFATLLMGTCLLLMHFFMNLNSYVISLLIKVGVAVAAYGIIILIMRHNGVMFFVNEIKNKIAKRKAVKDANVETLSDDDDSMNKLE